MKPKIVYAICRIDYKFFHTIAKDLKKHEYHNITPMIPTVDVLIKSRKGLNHYKQVPLLFNYGFMRMDLETTFKKVYLDEVRKNVTGIVSWVKSLETLHRKRIRTRIDSAIDFDDFSKVATVPVTEVKRLIEIGKANRIYSADDITNLEIGDYITLRGYPYEGMSATVEEINLNNMSVRVQIYPGNGIIQIDLPLDNIFYSIYQDFDEYRLTVPDIEADLTQIPDGSIDELLINKQY